MIAANSNVVATAFAIGVALGAFIVLATIFMLHTLQERERGYRR